MNRISNPVDHREILTDVLSGSLEGRNAHLEASRALEGLKLDVTGRKILNTPYTIWQLLKHINYWQDKFLARLDGEVIDQDQSWTEGWEDTHNAQSEAELKAEIRKLVLGIDKARQYVNGGAMDNLLHSPPYETRFHVVQTMASHLSYHLAEIIILRRIFGAWPPPSGGLVW